ncbi:MAG: non-heme iron oxygenase ferredoxin subunit [Actinomycetota bacterium]|nr:non-heme iron oxygenase ferredoxin subunit [Actinomycetota bacterium]MDP2288652.1 non-heme iron oxygenase ferredoxin subunit [Actinomycetota bacterium]
MSEFVRVADLADIPEGSALKVLVGNKAVAVVNTREGVFAVSDICSHADVSLAEGEVDGCTLECWLHGSQFDLRTGLPLSPPAIARVDTYQVRLVDDGASTQVEVATEPEPWNPEERPSA